MALGLARRGFHIFPCKPRSKLPDTPHGCNDATVDVALIEQWWRQGPDCNIAIATGAASGVFVLDVDGDGGETTLRELEARHGPLPPTVEAITGKGRHAYFDWPGRDVRNSAGAIGAGLDIRCHGGYVLAPPSVHPSGKPYAWSVDSAKTFAPAPAWLLDRITALKNGNGNGATLPSEWHKLVTNGVDEGARDDTVTRLAGYLLRKYVDPVVVYELLVCWNMQRCHPPLPARDIERVVLSIGKKETERRHG
jgi:hypothetical protein